MVVLKPERSRGLEEIESDMREQLEGMPGVSVLFTTPLGMRIDEGLGGTPADLSVRIFGPDLDELARLAEQAEGRIAPLTELRTCGRSNSRAFRSCRSRSIGRQPQG